MAVEAVALVLRQHGDLEIAGVDEVREREVDEPVVAAERHRGLGAVERQRQQALALAARQHDPEDAWHRHVPTLLAGRLRQQALDRGHGDRQPLRAHLELVAQLVDGLLELEDLEQLPAPAAPPGMKPLGSTTEK